MRVEWTSYSSPIGALTVVECEAGPLVIEYPTRAVTIKWAVRLRAAIPELHISQGSCRITTTWLDDYFTGSAKPFPYPTHLKRWFDLSPAQTAVFKTLRKIPLGETRSYDDVARATRLHPRQIGWLVAANHLAILIPCHRVVGKDGSLVGYGGGLAKKRWLLDHELRAAGVVLK
ncbi:MAG TPA: methylated-DNA--[protein]-cysteine S-methyltransferase [Gemmatimonadales bacterium]|jgi:O-6-methylguanine DNA methyltransferase|nr:methylated-DNA--[protein]-cysteine S-methyltransferase [Gemmatimonadales bacterium]